MILAVDAMKMILEHFRKLILCAASEYDFGMFVFHQQRNGTNVENLGIKPFKVIQDD